MSTPRFTITNKTSAVDPRITHDAATGLDWQTIPFPDRMTWYEAKIVCRALRLGGHDDWRLPTRAELLTLVDDTRHNPAIDTEAFPNTPLAWFWTATPYAEESPIRGVWMVNFDIGSTSVGLDSREHRQYVRAVRGTFKG